MNPAKLELQRILTGGETFKSVWLNTFLALRCKNKKTWMKQLRKEKQREEEGVLQRSTGEDIGEECGTRGEFIELQRSQEQGKRGKSTEKREERVSFGGGWMWWLCGACVSRVPGAPSLVDHGWREDKSCSCTRGGGRGGGGWGKTGSESNPCLPLLPPTQAQTPSNPSYQKSRWVQPVTRKPVDITDHWVLTPALHFGEATNTVKSVMVPLKDSCHFLWERYCVVLVATFKQDKMRFNTEEHLCVVFSPPIVLALCPCVPAFCLLQSKGAVKPD